MTLPSEQPLFVCSPFNFENPVIEIILIIHGQWHIQETLSLQAIKIH